MTNLIFINEFYSQKLRILDIMDSSIKEGSEA